MEQQENGNKDKDAGSLGCLGVFGTFLLVVLALALETWLHCAVTAWMVRRFFM